MSCWNASILRSPVGQCCLSFDGLHADRSLLSSLGMPLTLGDGGLPSASGIALWHAIWIWVIFCDTLICDSKNGKFASQTVNYPCRACQLSWIFRWVGWCAWLRCGHMVAMGALWELANSFLWQHSEIFDKHHVWKFSEKKWALTILSCGPQKYFEYTN